MLVPAKANWDLEERRCKQNAVKPYCAGSIEIIFILLTKVIAVYVELFVIKV